MKMKELMPWRKKDLSAEREDHPFDALQRELSRVFDRFSHNFGGHELARREDWWGGTFPSVDISETEKEILVTAEIPGVDEKDLDVSLQGNQLMIRGEKREEKEDKGEHYYHKETSYGSFQRTVPLPMEVAEDQIEATYKKGVLKIKLPKTAAAQSARKKIAVH